MSHTPFPFISNVRMYENEEAGECGKELVITSFNDEGPSDESAVSPAECQNPESGVFARRMLPGNKNTADTDGGTNSAFLITQHLNDTVLLFVCQRTVQEHNEGQIRRLHSILGPISHI